MSLEEQLQQQLAIAESFYPAQVQELAQLTGDSEELVRQKLEYMEQTQMYHLSKYVMADVVLTYHRLQFHGRG